MWIGDIDVPQPVVDAFDAGTLVFFVGAGASLAPPSNLPDFEQLVRDLGALAGRPPTDDDLRHPDVFLGRLEISGVDVHQLVATAIDQPESQPNRLHAAIVSLAHAGRIPRVVTTNYDRHLAAAADVGTLGLNIFEAPALPVGDDFDGIVHLHGSLNQPSRMLVVTDSDFGRAYLREAWAARFLERMFSQFAVAFIGYSHGDVVMQYLARSLGPDHNRYVFTDDESNAEWRRLGLTPIAYPNATGDHSTLPASLERWVELASMGQVEHRARVADLVSGEPPTIPEEVSYLEAALQHKVRVTYFAENATFGDSDLDRAHRWFEWIEGRSSFECLLSVEAAGELTAQVLMSWIADQYILNENFSGIALRALGGRSWPAATWSVIAHRLFAYKGEFPKWLGPWIQLTLQNSPTRRSDLIDMMLMDKDWSNSFDLALMIFEDRTRPFLRRGFDFTDLSNSPQFEVELCGDEYWLTESWTRVFLPMLGEHLQQLLGLVTEQLASVYRSLRGLDPGSTFDPIAFSRSAIERHSQDSHRGPIDVLIDAARDCIELALARDALLGDLYLTAWSTSGDPILRRLSVHGWRVRNDRSSDEKLNWLREIEGLWEIPLQHEVFQLIKDTLATASEDVASWLVQAATAGPPEDENDGRSAYRIYNLLGWLSDVAPDLESASLAFEKAQGENPNFGRREHPDLNHYGSFGVVEDASPFSVPEMHDLVSQDPAASLSRLREFQTDRFTADGPTWTGALRSLQACVAANPADGKVLVQVLQPDDVDLREAIIFGWGQATLDQVLVDEVVEIIAGWDPQEIRRSVCSMLSNGGRPEHPTAWHQFDRARELASALWPAAPVEGAIVSGTELVMEAINHPAGDLAQFWTKVVQWEWSTHESTWDGIPQEVTAELDRLVTAPDRNGLLAKAYLGSQLHFFFGADREWCETSLLPLFDWTGNEEWAAAAWQGFLTWGRWNDGLLQAGLLDFYIATTRHTDALPDDLRRQLAGHLASLAMYAIPDPETWLTRFIADAPEEFRVEWAQQVTFALTDLEKLAATKQWNRWIAAYWAGRNSSVPLPFTPAEASATADWVLELPEARTRAIDLVLGSPASLDARRGFLYRLSELDLAAEADDWARLLTHLLRNTSGQQGELGHYLQGLVLKLRQGIPQPDLSALIDEAMRLGVTNAADW